MRGLYFKMSKSSHEKLIEKIKKVFELNSKKIEPNQEYYNILN